ncbi:MAG: anaerobic sulfatase maturase [Deltaproteobacteria bacterium]|nr:anaerobic sulfatase maturase [Deltaproteobacteria bacterium]
MVKASRSFQIFVKPIGAACNLGCSYCYYLEKSRLNPDGHNTRMPRDILEAYIKQHIHASPDSTIRFSWHGGEPTLMGLEYFQEILEIQKRYRPPDKRVLNGVQTNGTLLTEEWCRFFIKHGFSIGLSLDGPQEMHDRYRLTKQGDPTHQKALRGYHLLRQHGLTPDILCVVNAFNVQYPSQVYGFFKEIKARYIGFLPLVEPEADEESGVSPGTVPAEAFGQFLCTVFDEWKDQDIGTIKVQIFEEAVKTALDEEHELCIFRNTCGDVPVLEQNGDFYSCDHFVDPQHRLGNIQDTPLIDLLEDPELISFGQNKWTTLPRYCRTCDVLSMCYGECPKNRFIQTPEGEKGLNYLCSGYKGFFHHCRPFVQQLAALRQRQIREEQHAAPAVGAIARSKIGRNDPCPCGSGKKYKKCCLGR